MIQEANLSWRYSDTESNLVMPWYTKPALEWLKKQDVNKWNVFEYGAGYSTIWWRLNANILKSVEHDFRWATAMGANWKKDKEQYIECFGGSKMLYDCIIVDGEWRLDCVLNCEPWLKPGGFMIIDNWGQEDFPEEACNAAEEFLVGWTKTLYKQANHSRWCTAIFQKPN